jgi:hypothetical protein
MYPTELRYLHQSRVALQNAQHLKVMFVSDVDLA